MKNPRQMLVWAKVVLGKHRLARNLLILLVAGVDLNHRPLGYEFNSWFPWR